MSEKNCFVPKYRRVRRLIADGLSDGQILDAFEQGGQSVTQTYAKALRRQIERERQQRTPIDVIALAVRFVADCGGIDSARKRLRDFAVAKAVIGGAA